MPDRAWDASNALTILGPGKGFATNQDGSAIVGHESFEPLLWTEAGGLQALDPGAGFGEYGTALGVSDDGETVVGADRTSAFMATIPNVPWIDLHESNFHVWGARVWRPGMGWRPLGEVAQALGVAIPMNTTLHVAADISGDGRRFVGTAHAQGDDQAFVLDLPEFTETYCTSQTNSQGCAPSIGAGGTVSASSGSGFHVTASDVLANVSGLLIYCVSGSAAIPFNGGTLCLSGVRRTSLQSSGGSVGCEGTFDLDFNAFVAAGSDLTLTTGKQVWAQYWSRDPFLRPPANTNLTDAVTFRLMP